MTDEEELVAAGVLIGIALLSGNKTLIRLCEIAFLPHHSPRLRPQIPQRPPKVIEWIQ